MKNYFYFVSALSFLLFILMFVFFSDIEYQLFIKSTSIQSVATYMEYHFSLEQVKAFFLLTAIGLLILARIENLREKIDQKSQKN